MKTLTKGGIVIENIKVGDIHYEYEYGFCIKSEVIEEPKLIDGSYFWKSKNISTGKIIEYGQNPEYSAYGLNLYDYEAYKGCKQI